MKRLLGLCAVGLLLSGCASSDELRRLDDRVSELETRVEQLEGAVHDLETARRELSQRLDALDRRSSALDALNATLTEELTEVRDCLRESSFSGVPVAIGDASIDEGLLGLYISGTLYLDSWACR